MVTRLRPHAPQHDGSATEQQPQNDGGGFLLVESDSRWAEPMMSALRAPCRLMREGPDVVDYLLGRGSYADRKKFPLPKVVLLDFDLPESLRIELLKYSRSKSVLRQIPFIVLKLEFKPHELLEAYASGAASCIEVPQDRADLERVAQAIERYWLRFNLIPPLPKSKLDF